MGNKVMNEEVKLDKGTLEMLLAINKTIRELQTRRELIIQTFKNAMGLDESFVLNPDGVFRKKEDDKERA